MKFMDEYHKELFVCVADRMRRKDVYHTVLAYLITLDEVCREHIEEMFDFEADCIRNCIKKAWQTGTSIKTTLLAYNLFTDGTGWCPKNMKRYCTPAEIFCGEYAEYYSEAVKMRYSLEVKE